MNVFEKRKRKIFTRKKWKRKKETRREKMMHSSLGKRGEKY